MEWGQRERYCSAPVLFWFLTKLFVVGYSFGEKKVETKIGTCSLLCL